MNVCYSDTSSTVFAGSWRMHIIIAVKIVNVGHANSKCSSPKDAARVLAYSSSRRLENKQR